MQHIKLKTINNVVVKPIKKKEEDLKPVRGGELVPMDINVFNVAPTDTGKTTVTKTMIEHIVTENTKIVAFVSTIFNDDNWIAIEEWAEEHDIDFEPHDSIMEDGVNLLKQYVEQFKQEAKERKKKRHQQMIKNLLPKKQFGGYRFDKPADAEEDKPKKQKYQERRYIFIFDDIADETRGTEYTTLLKKARHYGVTTITNSQDLKDINKPARKQIKLFLLFRGLDEERLADVYDSFGRSPTVTFEQFQEVYKYATTEPYNFLYVQPRKNDYRKNFNKQIPLI